MQHPCETGGIIGTDESGTIMAFQFDETRSSNPFEYCPNVEFLEEVINGAWEKENISFAGFVHSHLHNCEISPPDITYARDILMANPALNYIFLGIVILDRKTDFIRFFHISKNSMEECHVEIA